MPLLHIHIQQHGQAQPCSRRQKPCLATPGNLVWIGDFIEPSVYSLRLAAQRKQMPPRFPAL